MMMEPIRRRRLVEDESFIGVRVGVLLIVGLLMFGVIAFRLWYLQILTGDEYADNSERNRVRTVIVEAPRGGIYDRNGVPLVKNRAGLSVGFLPMNMPDSDSEEFYAMIYRLAELLELPGAQLLADYERAKSEPYLTHVVKEDVPENTVVAYLEEHNEDFPGVEVQKTFLREYTYANGVMLSHVLGYVGEISDNDLDQPEFAELTGGTHVGKDGVERQYDAYLRGEDGLRQVEVSASGKPVRMINDTPADTGYNLILTIDSELQDAAEAALVEGIRMAHDQGYPNAAAGAVVAMDPRNGEILAMVSYPDYDPEKWVGGISQADYSLYNSEEANYPLFNRALSGLYPAGSTFKPFVATVALDAGIVNWDHTVTCRGRYRVEYQVGKEKDYQIWKDWTFPYGHGETNLVQAIPRSCDIYFYQLGHTLYQKDTPVFQNGIRRYGFGRTTGVDLPGESERSVVPDKVWAREQGTQWKTGDEINLSIGQGDLATTPLQMAVALSALVNGGTVWVPHVALEIRDSSNRVISTLEPDERSRLDMDQDILEKVKWGMRLVCQSREGTAWETWWRFPVDVGGKTGTAEVKRGFEQLDDYSMFIGYAPANEEVLPEIVVAAIVEQGGHGSTVAAPVVRRVMEAYYDLPNYFFYFKEFSE